MQTLSRRRRASRRANRTTAIGLDENSHFSGNADDAGKQHFAMDM